jgi:uncharacterized SAM-binding protein YcdF (DUF218 family)
MSINFFKGKNIKLAVTAIFIIILIIPFITYRYWLPEVAEYLIVQDELVPADVIVIISGNGSRYQYGVKLFNDGYAKYILFNYNKEDVFNVVGVKFDPEAEIKNLAISNGIPLSRILTESRCASTYEDMLYAKENIIKKQFKSAIIVSSNYHMRRVYSTVKKVFKENNIKIIFAPVPANMNGINPDGWWTREYDLVNVFEEYVKLVFYWLKHRI